VLQIKPYVEALAGSKAQEDADLAPARAEETKKQLELNIAQIDVQIMQTETTINQLTRRYPLDIASVIKGMDNLALMTRQRNQLANIIDQMFPA